MARLGQVGCPVLRPERRFVGSVFDPPRAPPGPRQAWPAVWLLVSGTPSGLAPSHHEVSRRTPPGSFSA